MEQVYSVDIGGAIFAGYKVSLSKTKNLDNIITPLYIKRKSDEIPYFWIGLNLMVF